MSDDLRSCYALLMVLIRFDLIDSYIGVYSYTEKYGENNGKEKRR